MSEFSKSCKECSKSFNTIQACLAHEMIAHVKVTEQQQNNSRKRPRRRASMKLVETDYYKQLREEAMEKILKCANGLGFSTLAKIYQPASENLFDVYEMIVEDLRRVLDPQGSYKIQPFGSAITGITFKDSDIDFYIEPPTNKKSKKQFSKVYKTLQTSSTFSEVIAIWQARVPIVKCVHLKTGYPLDINTSSGHGVYNSEFLEKLIKSDQRFQPAILILRIWAKYRGINKIGGMNSYCLTLMFFFYLQDLEIVPSFKTIQAWAKPEMFDDINFGLNSQALGKSTDGATVRQLVEGFFEYYYNFDFEHRILSLYLGHAITWEFLKFENNFPEYHAQVELFKRKQSDEEEPGNINLPLSVMVVQDPFCLYQNTSKSVNPSLLERIQKHMQMTSMICKQIVNLSDQWWLVKVLFDVIEGSDGKDDPQNRDQARLGKKKNKQDNSSNQEILKPVKEPRKKFTFSLSPLDQELFYIRNHLRQECADEMFTLTDIHRIWSEKVVEYLKSILTDILGLEVEDNSKFAKSPKSDSQDDVHSDKLSFQARIFTNLDVWCGRVLTKKTSFGNLLKEQIKITKDSIETKKKGGIKSISIAASLTIQVRGNSSIDVDLVDDFNSNSKVMFEFFSGNVRQLLKGYLEIDLIKHGKF